MNTRMEGQRIFRKVRDARIERVAEFGTWVLVLAIVFGVQLLPDTIIDLSDAYIIAGGVIAFALFYYYVAWKVLEPSSRRFVKDLADIIFIGMIIMVAKEYSIYFFTLLFLPIAAAAFALDLLHSLLIATVAAVVIALEIILSGQGFINESSLLLSGSQFVIFIGITLFTRFLALQARREREQKESAKAHAARLTHDLEKERSLQAMEREFMDLTSHQLYTPLSIIRGYASLLAGEGKHLTAKQREFVDEILENSRRMLRQVEDLRLESRISQNRFVIAPRQADYLSFVENIYKEMQPHATQNKVKLEIKVPKNAVLARFDDEATRQILWNLLQNALQYTPARGKVTVQVSGSQGQVITTISDTGIGVPTGDAHRIFQRFFRSANAIGTFREGTGLGLSIAQELAQRQQATLSYEPNKPKGSRFILTLPA